MSVLVNFMNGILILLRDVGNKALSLALLIYGLKLAFSRDAQEREDSKRMLILILISFVLINLSDKIVEELLALI